MSSASTLQLRRSCSVRRAALVVLEVAVGAQVHVQAAHADLGLVGGVEPAQVPLVDPGPHVLAHAVGRQPLEARHVRRLPPVGLAVDLLELGVGAVQLLTSGRLELHLLSLDDPHARLGLGGQQLVLVRALGAEPFGDELDVVFADQHLGLEVVDGGEHGAERRRRVVAVATHPPGDLGVGLGPLQGACNGRSARPRRGAPPTRRTRPPASSRDTKRNRWRDRSRSLIAASR